MSGTYDIQDKSKELLTRILEKGIKPHAEAISRASLAGEVSVVFYEIQIGEPALVSALRSLGWRGGTSECVRLSRTRAERLADNLPPVDSASKWLRGHRPGRIFAFTGKGSICVNFRPERGYWLEPGTLEREWLS
jgi:hypothetical protein